MSARRVLLPLAGLYAAGLAVKNLGYRRGWLRQHRLGWPVVSVGNLSVGGAGKTPFVAELARLLGERHVHVDILSRGYGRRSPVAVERVPPESMDAARYGDEPLLLAKATGAPVYVGSSRHAAGQAAERDGVVSGGTPEVAGGEWPPALHLLDDGFQHRGLARTVDIVLLHPKDVEDRLLPQGRLREGLTALRRADFAVLREDDEHSESALTDAGIEVPVWRVRRRVQAPTVNGPAVAFAAIAHPREFFQSLRAEGLRLEQTFAFRDHHGFTAAELRAIAKAGERAAALVTTEKDLLRLSQEQRVWLKSRCVLLAAPLRVELLDAAACLRSLKERLVPRLPG